MTRDGGIRVPAQGTPECMITWVRKPDDTIRLYASRNLHDTGWGQATQSDGPTRWLLDTTMDHVLIVDRATPGEAIAWVLARWAREDAEAELGRGMIGSSGRALPPPGG